jgi:hypothetical protein
MDNQVRYPSRFHAREDWPIARVTPSSRRLRNVARPGCSRPYPRLPDDPVVSQFEIGSGFGWRG